MRIMREFGRHVLWPAARCVKSACVSWRDSIRTAAILSLADFRIGILEAELEEAREELQRALERERQARSLVDQIEQLKRLRPGPEERF